MSKSERGQPMTRQAVNYIERLAGERAKLGRVWPHSCGYYLADLYACQVRLSSRGQPGPFGGGLEPRTRFDGH
jgi:hypothetical protein